MNVDVEVLYRRFGPMVLRRCRRLLRDEARAVDAMHDVFVELLVRRERLEVRAPSSLLLTVATHVCLNRLRSDRRRPEDRDQELLLAIACQTAPSPEAHTLSRRVLDTVFGQTAESTQLIAVLHYVDRLTLEEVAAEVGLSVSGVRKRLRTLRHKLPLSDEESR